MSNLIVPLCRDLPRQWVYAFPGMRVHTAANEQAFRSKETKLRGGELLSRDQRSRINDLIHSYRNASIGFMREAFRAGKNPEMMPIMDSSTNDINTTTDEIRRKMSPS